MTSPIKTAELCASSRDMFNRALERWLEICPPKATVDWIVANQEKALKCLKEAPTIKDSVHVRHRFISAVVAYLRYEVDRPEALAQWKALIKVNYEPMTEHYLSGEPTERQKDKQITWKEIEKVRDELPLGETKLLLAFYTYIPPIRADLYACSLFDDEEQMDAAGMNEDEEFELGKPEWNYVVVDGECPRLVLNDYKTSKSHGEIIHELPRELHVLLKAFLVQHQKARMHLFENSKGDPYTRSTFSTWCCRRLKEAFGKPMSLTAIRHAYCSSLDFNRPIKELNAIAHGMGQKVSTQRIYKWDSQETKNEVIIPTRSE
jgi:hypothetical protein